MDLWNSSNYNLKMVTFHPFFIGSKKGYSLAIGFHSPTLKKIVLSNLWQLRLSKLFYSFICSFSLWAVERNTQGGECDATVQTNCLQSQNLPLTLGWLRPTTARKQKFMYLYIEEWHILGFSTVWGEPSNVQLFPSCLACSNISQWFCQ